MRRIIKTIIGDGFPSNGDEPRSIGICCYKPFVFCEDWIRSAFKNLINSSRREGAPQLIPGSLEHEYATHSNA